MKVTMTFELTAYLAVLNVCPFLNRQGLILSDFKPTEKFSLLSLL